MAERGPIRPGGICVLYLVMAVVGLAAAWHAYAHAERKAELVSMVAFADNSWPTWFLSRPSP